MGLIDHYASRPPAKNYSYNFCNWENLRISAKIVFLFRKTIFEDFVVIIRKHLIFVIKTSFRCYCPQTTDFRGWVLGNSQSPDQILAKIVFFVAKTFSQGLPQFPHGEMGSYPCCWQNLILAEFFAAYRENRVFQPHL
jgi:hypothetical protein